MRVNLNFDVSSVPGKTGEYITFRKEIELDFLPVVEMTFFLADVYDGAWHGSLDTKVERVSCSLTSLVDGRPLVNVFFKTIDWGFLFSRTNCEVWARVREGLVADGWVII